MYHVRSYGITIEMSWCWKLDYADSITLSCQPKLKRIYFIFQMVLSSINYGISDSVQYCEKVIFPSATFDLCPDVISSYEMGDTDKTQLQ